MELIERIPLDRIQLLNRMDYHTFKKYTNKCKSEKDRKDYFRQFKDYLKNMLKSKGIMKRLYKHTDATPVGEGGRMFCGGSIQGMARDFRGFLCNGITTDIDMKNAHPTILLWLCNKYSIECPQLREYVANRDGILTQLVALGKDKEYWKNQILIITNTSWEQRRHKSDFMKAYDKEMKHIQSELIKNKELEHIWSNRPIKEYNFLGSAINRILCHYENEILQLMVNSINKRAEIMSLMFDGLMVYGTYNIQELQEVTAPYGIQLSIKEHSTELEESELRLLPEQEEEKLTELETAKRLYEAYPHWKYCNGLWVFNEENGLWTTDATTKHKICIEYGIGSKCQDNSNRNGVLLSLQTLCIDTNFISDNALSSRYMLLFDDGIYDCRTSQFTKGFNPKVVFFGKINQNWPVEIDKDYMESIQFRLFEQPLDNQGLYLLHQLARGLFGNNPKRLLLGLGQSNSGKSLLTKAIMASCGSYAAPFNAECLAVSKSTADEASQMRWAYLLRHQRLILSNEIKMNSPMSINGMKKVASGGDKLVGRTHGGEEQSFIPMFLPFILANDFKISGCDEALNDRLKVITYKKKYTDNPSKDELKADPHIADEIETPKFKSHFLLLLIKYYSIIVEEPLVMNESKKMWGIEEVNVIDLVKNDYDFTDNKEDFVVAREFIELCNEHDITQTKLGRELTKYAKQRGYDNVLTDKKRVDGVSVNVWRGIKKKPEDPTCEITLKKEDLI